ncbi:hypothetical protein NA56DRAFT_500197 [Hyaloscypha hepaticicola]|uniref:Uncharacterized protein n=1 Tax=Hyaloscypha hepaticicola TaxID=2082293 RepID=A0A2J6PE75_9HELO|nr:hypothetical protein NA56DRAFT_500197 [Hyaloscypha hepaticicola]
MEILSDCYNLGRLSSDTLPTLTEVTFRPHSIRCCSFIAVVRDGCDGRGVSFSQLAQLIESVGHVGKIDDFTIKPIEQHSFLLAGFSQYTSSRLPSGTILSPTVEANCVFDNTPSTTLQYSKAVDAGALLLEESEPSSSDDESGLSNSDPDLSSDDDAYSREKMQGSSTRINIPWEPLDEQRLAAYKKEDKSWKWIFKKFLGRTPAVVRTHALDHGTAQSQISFLRQVDRQQLKLYVPTCLEGFIGTTSFYRPVSTKEQVWLRDAAFKVRNIGGSDAWRNTRKWNETDLEGDTRRKVIAENN